MSNNSELSEENNKTTREDEITNKLDFITEAMKIQAEALKGLATALDSVLRNSINNSSSKSTATDPSGEIVITSYDIPPNHLDNSNSFKGKDTDVERFLAMCKRQFGFYTNFYKSEKKRVEFIEAHLGSASEWYYIFMSEKQREEPNSGLLLEELAKYFSTNIPDNLKLSRLLKLSHRWERERHWDSEALKRKFHSPNSTEEQSRKKQKFWDKKRNNNDNFKKPNNNYLKPSQGINTLFNLRIAFKVSKDGNIPYFSEEDISSMDLQLSLEDLNNKEVSFVTLNEDPDYNLKLLPREYWKYSSVFNKVANKSLPPHRPGLDCGIDLVPGAQLHKGPVYPMI
ncbi:hypothetical protein PIROE2DRAFT_61975 [Piromyces sp. E2]|nr:hypothetical protein PIROE2DRAFT_61975 [Piromyces sp. E2]|eukprot:OUM62321.1 hypothetical protein PIROE2DRAFT_61975 [Piromyces sp. E2]